MATKRAIRDAEKFALDVIAKSDSRPGESFADVLKRRGPLLVEAEPTESHGEVSTKDLLAKTYRFRWGGVLKKNDDKTENAQASLEAALRVVVCAAEDGTLSKGSLSEQDCRVLRDLIEPTSPHGLEQATLSRLSEERVQTLESELTLVRQERDAVLAAVLPTTEESQRLRAVALQEAQGKDTAARIAELTKLSQDLQAAKVLKEVIACGLDYEKAFAIFRQATKAVGDDVVRATLQDYMTELRRLLMDKPNSEGKGHFGSLEANRAFAAALSKALEATHLWLAVPGGERANKIVVTNPDGGPTTGYFLLRLPTGDTRSALSTRDRTERGRLPPLKVE